MTIIRTKCPSCGEVDMGAGAISLSLGTDGERGAFAFTCPECLVEVNRPASRKTVALLIAAGVEPAPIPDLLESVDWSFPLEDQSPNPGAAAFSLDDLIGFHFLLEDDAAIADLLSLEH
jgi:predicted RNA-binding Zn-ribbon protein involved in translation (DUF1610 family)